MATLKTFLLIVVVGYAALLGVMYFAQRALMYFPENIRVEPAAAGLPQAEEVVIEAADHERVIAWHVAPRGDKPVVLYLHGNGGALRHRVTRFRDLTNDGTGLLALSYRGYGGSSGSPTEAGLIADATAAYDFVAARYPVERIVLWGESLGSGVAVALAAEKPVARMVLEAPFTSTADVGAAAYWFIPVRLLMKDQFRSDLRIGKVKVPVLVLHGDRDAVVPFALGERLYALITSPKRFARIEGGGHENLSDYGAMKIARAFLAEK
jgi:hypothetical protein